MKRVVTCVGVTVAAGLAGLAVAQWLLGFVPARDALGLLFGRGHLLALAGGRGIYELDLERAAVEQREAAGEPQDRQRDEKETLQALVANALARALAARKKIAAPDVGRELELLQWQFRDEKEWKRALGRNRLSPGALGRAIADDLRAGRWIGERIAAETAPTPDECRAFYDTHRELFFQPGRFRVNHLFLAAPPETPPEVVEQKRAKIDSLAQRLAAGEDFYELVAAESEDEQTKARGGDLGLFSESRMQPDFIAAIRNLPPAQVSPPIRTRLGFHLVQLIETRPPRQMSFDEVATEIALEIENEKRQAAVLGLVQKLVDQVEFVRGAP